MGYVKGIRWDNGMIEKEIFNVMNVLNISRMPSKTEIEKVNGNTTLTNAMNHRGGLYMWAKNLNLEIKECETKMGKAYENNVKNILIMQGYEVEQMSCKHPYDLLVNDSIKIDVKSSRRFYYNNNTCYYYTFNLEKRNATCDLYICYCVLDNGFSEKILVIPAKDLKLTQLSLGAISKYDKYNERWDIIKSFDTFYKQLA